MTVTQARLRRQAGQASPLLLALLLPAPAMATTYQTLCGNTPCSISLDANGIGDRRSFIPIGRIARWYAGGQET